jgi:hypothetical protein
MNKLQKNAWFEFAMVIIATLINTVFFAYMVASNTRGIDNIIICVLVGCIIGPLAFYYSYKDESKYDEREKMIRNRAFRWSTYALAFFLILSCLVPFFIIGAQGNIPVYYLPIIFWGCLLIAQTVHSFVILFQCAKEQDDG